MRNYKAEIIRKATGEEGVPATGETEFKADAPKNSEEFQRGYHQGFQEGYKAATEHMTQTQNMILDIIGGKKKAEYRAKIVRRAGGY